jgi:hypothetical protein
VTTRTRRLLVLAACVVALTIPAEVVLLQAITMDGRAAAADWATSLQEAEVGSYSAQLDRLPVQYRKALLRRLGPKKSAAIWQAHLTGYRDRHPELSVDQTDALNAIINLISVDTFTFPTSAERTAAQVLGARISELFGAEATRYLLHDLGARQVPFANQATPIAQRLQDFVREHFVVNAGDAHRCECIDAWECDATTEGNVICEKAAISGCVLDSDWPACGFIWLETCDGRCKTIYVQ